MSDRIRAIHGDSREVLKTLADCSVDSCVCDPPYSLVSIVKRFGNGQAPAKGNAAYMRASAGFMGQKWDTGETAHDPEFWREVYRVLKPGAHVVAFGGTRTFHRLVCAIEDAGFEIRDLISWIFGSGFPKSHNAGNGWGTALKPALEPITLARKPLVGTVAANVQQFGTGAINVDGCRVAGETPLRETTNGSEGMFGLGSRLAVGTTDRGRWPANVIHDGSEEVVGAFPESDAGSASGYDWRESKNDNPTHVTRNIKSGVHFGDSGSAARFFASFPKDNSVCGQDHASGAESFISLSNGAVVSALSNAVAASTQRLALNEQSFLALSTSVTASELRLIVASVTETIQNLERRFWLGLPPESITASVGHVMCAAVPEPTGITTITLRLLKSEHSVGLAMFNIIETSAVPGELGSGKRFHYSSKADSDDRIGSKHPTVKPIDLMQYLIRLVTPKGGLVLDPFSGTGVVGEAAYREGMRAILIEREAQYFEDIQRRIRLLMAGPEERARESIKASGKANLNPGPLFEGAA